MLRIVNMIPFCMSGESHQDSEPNLAVNPENTQEMAATAFTPAPIGGQNAPLYVSPDGGNTWCLRTIVPGNDPLTGTHDITVAFATKGGKLYAGLRNGTTDHLQILFTSSFKAPVVMTPLGGVDRDREDQPWIIARSTMTNGVWQDRVFVGNNDFAQPNGMTATVDVSQDAGGALGPVQFATNQIEQRSTGNNNIHINDLSAIRIAAHPDGTVYAAYQHMDVNEAHVIVTRDNNWGNGGNGVAPFAALVEQSGVPFAPPDIGVRAAPNVFFPRDCMGHQRLGNDLAIAVHPDTSGTVWLAYCARTNGRAGTGSTLHVLRSDTSGQNWTEKRTLDNVTNPALAVNAQGRLGLAYQQYDPAGHTWTTKLELTFSDWADFRSMTLHQAPADVPPRAFHPYLGDYIKLLTVGDDFYGVFCGNNTPDLANFPNKVTYQRAVDWPTKRLLCTDMVTEVDPSIDPFFFHWWNAASDTGVPIQVASPDLLHKSSRPRRPPKRPQKSPKPRGPKKPAKPRRK